MLTLALVCLVAQTTISGTLVPPRDRVPLPTTGTSALKGRVIDGVTGAAVPRARVRLMGGGGQRPSVLTDAAGVFAFRDLPAGAFTVSADKSTYMSGRYPEGGRTLRSLTKPILLAAGEANESIVVPLYRGGAIMGRVLDASGDPVESAEVRLMRVAGSGGRPTMRSGTSTNDLGEFRLGKLEPGTYILMALARRMGGEELALPNVEPPPQPVPSYYPGVVAIDLAQPIRIERGQTVPDIDIILGEAVPSVVSGTVVAEDGQPLTTGGYIMARANVKDMQFSVDVANGQVRPDGTFRMMMPPGDYVLEVRANSSGGGGPYVERMGLTRLSVGGNVDGVSIAIGRGASASGRIVFEGGSPLPQNPAQLQFPLFSQEGMGCRQGRMTIAADWTFTVEGLSGTCSAPAMVGLGGGWTLKSLQINGEEFDSETITFEPGQRLRNVQVVLTDRRSSVTFRVADEAGHTTREYVGLLFQVVNGQVPQSTIRTLVPPSDERIALMMAANPGRGMPPSARRESLQVMRPGEYYAIALDDMIAEDSRDPAFIAKLVDAATRVTVGEGPDTPISVRRQRLADIVKR